MPPCYWLPDPVAAQRRWEDHRVGRHAEEVHFSYRSFAPYRKFIPTWLCKVETAAAGERIDRSEDGTARLLNFRQRSFQLIAVQNNQSRTCCRGGHQIRLEEAA